MNKFFIFLLYVWQLPQVIIGSIVYLYYKHNIKDTYNRGIVKYYFVKDFPGGISLFPFIIISYKSMYNVNSINHEYGHYIQSLYLGPLYIFIIGIPSATWAFLYGRIIKETHNGYYKFYTEKWADKLGSVIRG